MTTKSKPKPEPIDFTQSLNRAMLASRIMDPFVFPDVAKAIEMERAKAGTGKATFVKACEKVIKDNDQLIDAMWNSIKASLANPLNGYCW